MENDNKKIKSTKQDIKHLIKLCLFSALLGLILSKYVVTNSIVPSGSMEPNLEEGSRFILNRLAYIANEPKRGDIIVFNAPDRENTLYVKRIIALSGEVVQGRNGQIYINDKLLKEDYIEGNITSDFGPYSIPDGAYFMMGDNRPFSLDARYWENKYIYKDDIIGKAWFEYSPRFQIFKEIDYDY